MEKSKKQKFSHEKWRQMSEQQMKRDCLGETVLGDGVKCTDCLMQWVK